MGLTFTGPAYFTLFLKIKNLRIAVAMKCYYKSIYATSSRTTSKGRPKALVFLLCFADTLVVKLYRLLEYNNMI